MLKKKTFVFHNTLTYENLLIKKILVKFVYTKFLIYKVINVTKKHKIIFLENYLEEFSLNLKKKFRRLNFFFKLKSGNFFKGHLFSLKHSKLKYYSFISVRLKTYLKKNFYLTLKKLKYFFRQSNLIFIYKSIRGGFLGFTNNISGYLSKKHLLTSNQSIFKYKNYFLLYNVICISYSLSNFKSFIFSKCGIIKKFRKHKSESKILIFKKFKFFFNVNFNYYKCLLKYISFVLSKNNSFILLKQYYITFFFKLYKLILS